MSMNSQLEKDLVQRYIRGDELALERLLAMHKDKVYGYILKLVKDVEITEDIFQDTFIKVIRTLKSGNYNEEGKFLPWVMRIAHNLVIDHFRKGKRMKMLRSTDEYNVFDTIKDENPIIEDQLFDDQVKQDLRKLIEYLPEEQKQVLKMRLYQQLSFKEIAEDTNVSINTALGRMRYALINLRKLIEEHKIEMMKY